MKKILTYAIAVVAIAAGALIGVKNFDSRDNLTEIQLENIAALSDDGEVDFSMLCAKEIHYTGSWSDMPLHCKTCSYRPGYAGTNDSRCK